MQAQELNRKHDYGFLNNGGEIGNIILNRSWTDSALGPIENWPQSLRTTLSIILNSKFPMFLFWGKEHLCFYNDAYRPSLGNTGKHPAAIGKNAKECWPEIWEFIKPIIDNVMSGGQAVWYEDQLLPIFRNGHMEDVYWTFSYSAVIDEKGKPAGVFVVCNETTDKLKILKIVSDNRNELEFAINAADLGTWDMNTVTYDLVVNNRLKEWFGLNISDEVPLSVATDVIDINDRQIVLDNIFNALQFTSGGLYNVTYKINNPINKQERIVRAIGKVLFDEKHSPYRFNGVVLDITNEVNSRQELEKSENNFRKLVEQASVAICVLKEPDYKVTIANERMLELWGKSIEDVLHKPIFTGLPEARKQGLEELLLHVFTTGERYLANELPINLPRNGKLELVYLNFVYEALKDNNGVIEGIMAIATDVTEQVQARLKIEDAEERARLAADAVNLGIYDYNLFSGEFISSPQVFTIFGFTEPVAREQLVNIIHPADKKIYLEAHENLLITGILFYELRIIWNDKSIHWIRVQGKIFFDSDKNPARLLGTILDITNQIRAEEDLMKINQRLEIALEVGQLGSYELNLDTGKIEGSEQFRKNFGLDKSRLLKFDDILNVIIPDQRKIVKEAFSESIKNKQVYNAEYKIQWPDKSIRWIKSSAKAQYDENFKPTVFIGVTLDITEHKQLQQQKDDFLGIASHELKTPVTTIKAYSQLLEEILLQKGDVKEATMVTRMGAQVNRLTNLIADLLDVTKINSGKLQLNNTRFNFNAVINDIIQDIQNTAPQFKIEKDFSEIIFVYADRERIIQVITNLITNSIKYSPIKKTIIIHCEVKNKEVILCVEDFGVGISEDHQLKVFEQFYRVSGDMQHTFPGLGLGLYISSEIIKRIGGRIWVNSIEGQGSTFCFSLPLNNDEN